MRLPRIMLAAPASGSGKTMITCGLLQVLKNRGLRPMSFKCGPDYIDPMFHAKVIGIPSRNLDGFLAGREQISSLFARAAAKADVSVIEGVMGFYDGVAGITTEASTWEVADATDTPVILIINMRGMSLSAGSLIKGFLTPPDGGDSHIRGVILNQTSEMMYRELKPVLEKQCKIPVLGYVPKTDDCAVESRHLGLVLPEELSDLRERLDRLAALLEQTLDIDAILRLADTAAPVREASEDFGMERLVREKTAASAENASLPDSIPLSEGKTESAARTHSAHSEGACITGCRNENVFPCRFEKPEPDADANRGNVPIIGIARDEAFCFYYEENLELLETLGAKLVFFSPLHDAKLPEPLDGLLLGGGYPELYAGKLSANDAMRAAIQTRITGGVPYLAECGGFLYLHRELSDMDGNFYPMAGVVDGKAYYTGKLGRFGYVELTANTDCMLAKAGETIRAHEFHYYDSTANGAAFHAKKPHRKRSWDCILAGTQYAAGFPHLYYPSNPEFAARFVEQCRKYRAQR